jgi:hypothetical protein
MSHKDKQPQVSLLLGGKTLSVQLKTSEKLFSELQASTQSIERDSSRFMGYWDTIQAMAKLGVAAVNGYHRGTPQLINLDVECTGNPKVKVFLVPMKETVIFHGKKHMQFNSMYVCTLKVAGDRHGKQAQPQRGGIADFGFLRSQDSVPSDHGGGGGGGRGYVGHPKVGGSDDSLEDSD